MPNPTDEALVYAIALGESFTVHEPLPGRAKKKTFKELIVPSLFKHDYTLRQHSRPLAHFIASHFFERTVMVLDVEGEDWAYWTVSDGRTGAYMRFIGPTESTALSIAREMASEKVDTKLGAFDAAEARLSQAKTKREAATLRGRNAARSWPPAKGSQEEQALELANKGVDFFSYSMKKSTSLSGHATRNSSKAAFLTKLKDKSLHLCLLETKEKRLLGFDGVVGVVAYFCDAKDPRSVPILGFEWEAFPAKPGD